MTTVVTWNLQGRLQPDLDAVVDVLAGLEPDVVALQEVQRHQAEALADRLGFMMVWAFKHWPVLARSEGLAVMAPVFDGVERIVLAHRWRFWSWRRRVALAVTLGGDGPAVRVLDVHLGADVADSERIRQVGRLLDPHDAPDVIAGDLNVRPGDVVLDRFAQRGYRDAWRLVHAADADVAVAAGAGAPGATNWSPGPRTGPPDQRLDYVLCGPRWVPVEVSVASDASDHVGVSDLAALSDHLPLRAVIAPVAADPG